MNIVITGGAGFIGAKLCGKLLAEGTLLTTAGVQKITRVTVLDQASVPLPPDDRLVSLVGNANDLSDLKRAFAGGVDVIFHLAAVVSVAAERDFDLGYAVNLAGTMALLDLCRSLPRPPQVIMASSAAVYGGPLPESVGEETALFPQTSYGTQKAVAELLINDYTRKGYIHGCCLRLPTIVVRPGKPNMAASSFASSLVREPLLGNDYVCPVPASTQLCLLSVRRVVASFAHAASLSKATLGHTVAVQLPGLTLTVNDLLEALGQVAGPNVAERVSFLPQADIVSIVNGWPASFAARRALRLGFSHDDNAAQIISAFIADELGGRAKL